MYKIINNTTISTNIHQNLERASYRVQTNTNVYYIQHILNKWIGSNNIIEKGKCTDPFGGRETQQLTLALATGSE